MNNQKCKLRTITENDYEFIYQVKKDAYIKYVEVYYGKWDEEQQKVYFEKFITTYGDGAFIITLGGKDIGFYNGITSDDYRETRVIGESQFVGEYYEFRSCA